MRGVVTAYRRLLANRPLTRLLAGEFISSIGDWLYLVALLIILYERTNDPVLLGIVGAARVLPYVFLSIPAGVVADRYDRRMVLLITDLGRGALMVVLAWLAFIDGPIEAIVVVTILATCLSSFFGPTIGAYLPSLVNDESDLGPANTAYASLDNVAFVVGPAVAAIILGISGNLAVAFLLNALSFVVVAVILWGLPPSRPAASRPQAGADGEDGPAAPAPTLDWRSIRTPVSGLLVLNAVGGFVFGGMSMLTVVIAYDQLQGGEAATGALASAEGVGGLIGALITGVLVLRRRLGPPMIAGAVLAGVALGVLGMTSSLPVAMLAMAVASLGSLLISIVGETLFQRIVPDEARGRALGFLNTVMVLLYAAGSLLMPMAVSVVGIAPVLIGAGVLLGVAGVVTVVMLGPWAVQAPAPDAMRARLTALAMFDGLPPARLETAERRSVLVPMEPGQVIIRQGDPADRFYVIGEGAVEVTQVTDGGAPVVLRRMGEGEGFGEIGLLSGSPRTATVTAVGRGTLVALDGPDFLELVNGLGVTSPFVDLQIRQPAPSA
jgi:MFS family permease